MSVNPISAIPASPVIRGIEWLGECIGYPESDVKGDTYPMTWADDGEIYASAGDPNWGVNETGTEAGRYEAYSGLDVEKFSGGPTDYRIAKCSLMKTYVGWGGDGPKPSGMICVKGILYLAFQNMLRMRKPAYGLRSQHGSDASIVYSLCKGGIWVPALGNIPAPMFPGHKFGGPAFVNFGRDNAGARDEYVYIFSPDSESAYEPAGRMVLARAPKEKLRERGASEGKILLTQKQLLEMQIAQAALSGESASKQIMQLNRVNIALRGLADQSSGLAKLYEKMQDTFSHAFSALGRGIADCIVEAKSWGDMFIGVVKNIADFSREKLLRLTTRLAPMTRGLIPAPSRRSGPGVPRR
jgi:hypothetical protein